VFALAWLVGALARRRRASPAPAEVPTVRLPDPFPPDAPARAPGGPYRAPPSQDPTGGAPDAPGPAEAPPGPEVGLFVPPAWWRSFWALAAEGRVNGFDPDRARAVLAEHDAATLADREAVRAFEAAAAEAERLQFVGPAERGRLAFRYTVHRSLLAL
jgi:hypothetical protein